MNDKTYRIRTLIIPFFSPLEYAFSVVLRPIFMPIIKEYIKMNMRDINEFVRLFMEKSILRIVKNNDSIKIKIII